MQSAAIGAKKLLVDDKITACVKEIDLLGVVRKVLNRKTLSGETFCFPEKSLLLQAADWPTTNFLGVNVLLFCCNRIGQLCLSGPTVTVVALQATIMCLIHFGFILGIL